MNCKGETCPLKMDTDKGCPFYQGECTYKTVEINEELVRKIQVENYGEMEFTGEIIR